MTPSSLAEKARDHLRGRITRGELMPGESIKERDLSEELGISRIPIREALRLLASEGFVTLSPRRSAVVRELVPEDLRELFEVREILEVHQVALAIRNASVVEKEDLLRMVEQERQALDAGDVDRLDELNALFHQRLIEMTHNSLLATIMAPLQGRLSWLFNQNPRTGEMTEDHYGIAKAIWAGDAQAAQELALRHVQRSLQSAHDWLFERPL